MYHKTCNMNHVSQNMYQIRHKRHIRQKARALFCYMLHGICYLFFLPLVSFAQTNCPPNRLCNPIKFKNLTSFFLELVNVVIQYGALLIVLMLVFAGFKFVVAQGNPEKVSEARTMLTWIIVGAFVLLGVFVIRAAICGTIGQLGVDIDCEVTKLNG